MSPFIDRLIAAQHAKHSRLILGLDPAPATIEPVTGPLGGLPGKDLRSVLERFCLEAVDACAEYCVAVKLQIAFFEAWGLPGLEAYAALLPAIRERGLLTIGDVKRGDIATTAEAYAYAHLGPSDPLDPRTGPFEADAVTLAPYMGLDSISPFLSRVRNRGKGLFILVRTSNPSATDFQYYQGDVEDSTPLFYAVGEAVAKWGQESVSSGWSSVGAVVGLTAPAEGELLRKLMPHTPFLVPGAGPQGGDPLTLRRFAAADGLGAYVAASRGILEAYKAAPGLTFGQAAGKAAEKLRSDIETPFQL